VPGGAEVKPSLGAAERKVLLLSSPNPFLDDPERQKQFRRDFISEVTTSPEPEHLRLLSDELHKEVLLAIGDRSKPDVTREELSQFFKRRIA